MPNLAVLGFQWGDEVKVIDLAVEHYVVVVRCQGGNNAGHTVQVADRAYKLSQIPSGVLRPDKIGVAGNGVVINPEALLGEIDSLRSLGVDVESNLLVSNRAHVMFPYHPVLERPSEASPRKRRIGTTSRGVGPCYEDKVARRGIRVAELLSPTQFPDRFRARASEKSAVAEALGVHEPWDVEAALARYQELAERMRPFVTDTGKCLNQAIQDGKRLLFEGAQTTMLDIDFGTYPYLTSSNATAGGLCTGSEVSPRFLHHIVGVAKAYATRVGEGPLVTEADGPAGDEPRQGGAEYGTVTGPPRRCGWFDIPLLRYAHAINQLSPRSSPSWMCSNTWTRFQFARATATRERRWTGCPRSPKSMRRSSRSTKNCRDGAAPQRGSPSSSSCPAPPRTTSRYGDRHQSAHRRIHPVHPPAGVPKLLRHRLDLPVGQGSEHAEPNLSRRARQPVDQGRPVDQAGAVRVDDHVPDHEVVRRPCL
ncbi:MAG: adenylosuccinate synthetase [Bryobacterales bacterium]|nr:adenylosuccinate synthetase [Bryobacterales bacterium]